MINTKKNTAENTEKNYEIRVTRANRIKDNTYGFSMVVNGVTIYSCIYKEGKKDDGTEWSFVNLPQSKSGDKYYDLVWFPRTKETTELIANQIASLIG